jgi:hypothetical protein
MISDDLVRAVQSRGPEPTNIIEGLRRDRTRTIRGRQQSIAAWCLEETTGRLGVDSWTGGSFAAAAAGLGAPHVGHSTGCSRPLKADIAGADINVGFAPNRTSEL